MPLNVTQKEGASTGHCAPLPDHSHSQSESSSSSLSANWHFLFTGLVLPMVCAVSAVENSLAIYVLVFRLRAPRAGSRRRSISGGGIGATSRTYFVVLAVAHIGYLICYHLSKNFAEYGLRFVTGGRFYFSLASRKDWICPIFRGCHFFFPHVLNWTYALLNLERLVAVHKPLLTRRIFTVRFNLWLVAALCVSGLLLCVYHGTFFRLLPPMSNLVLWPVDERELTCRLDTHRGDWFVFLALVTADIYCGPNLISLALALALLLRIRAAQLSRTRLFVNSVRRRQSSCQSGGNRAESEPQSLDQSGSQVALTGALTAVTMALAHVMLALPASALLVCFYASLVSGASAATIATLFKLQHFAMALMSVGSLADFVIYCCRIRAFRRALVQTCGCSKLLRF